MEFYFYSFQGSKDNISVIVVKLPGAKITIPPEHNESSSTSTKDDDENMREMGSPPDRDL